ncbi:MAG: NAD-dependent epimerase/dehydratase family protein [Clostridiaceae bacterium]|nr:NAD-dependent epimerase/dehydratase family protein [Clostridiaceae bacterium]
MIKILITGADSFVGRNLIKYSRYRNIQEIDIKGKPVEQIDFSEYDVVVHLAAIVHQSKKISETEYFRINRDLCLAVAKRAKEAGIKQFIFLSTVKVYGEYNPVKGTWNEHAICKPDDPYGRSKYEAEQGLRKLEDKNFTVTIIRPPLIYGSGVKANMLSITKIVDRFSYLPFGGIKNKRSFTAIENLVALIDRAIEMRASGIYIATDENPLSTTELIQLIAKALNKKIYLIKLPNFIIYLGKRIYPNIFDRLYGSFEIDNSHTRKILNYKPVISSQEGITRMVEAYKMSKDEE